MAIKQLGLRMFGAKTAKRQPEPMTATPEWRMMTARDLLAHVAPDGQAVVYTPLRIEGLSGQFAGVGYLFCGDAQYVQLVAWADRANPMATRYVRPLDAVRVDVTQAAGRASGVPRR